MELSIKGFRKSSPEGFGLGRRGISGIDGDEVCSMLVREMWVVEGTKLVGGSSQADTRASSLCVSGISYPLLGLRGRDTSSIDDA